MSLLRLSAVVGVLGTLLAVSVPTFLKNLSASKSTEAIEGLGHLSKRALLLAAEAPIETSFPPSAPLTPADVPRGVKVIDPEGTWDHLTWHALKFQPTEAHAFAYRFDSSYEPLPQVARFSARAHGDFDGDGTWSTFEVRGERRKGEAARVMAGLLIDRELE